MSIPIFEKIELIRASERLTQAEFAEKIGVSANTLNAMKSRGSSPRFEIVEKIASKWPRYAFWLLTGKTHSPMHMQPNCAAQTVLRFFEKIYNPRPEVNELMTKPEWFNRLIFLQCSDERNDLYAFLETKQSERSGIKQCILIGGGSMNFCSNDSGKNRLIDFAAFLAYQQRADLIKTSEMRLVTRTNLNSLHESLEIDETCLMMPDLAVRTEWLKKVYVNFTEWRMNGISYAPKYSHQDMR